MRAETGLTYDLQDYGNVLGAMEPPYQTSAIEQRHATQSDRPPSRRAAHRTSDISPSSVSRLMTLMFTDVVGSVALKAQHGDEPFLQLLERQNAIFDAVLASIPGAELIKRTGDGSLARFPGPRAAVEAALLFQWALAHEPWRPEPIKVRVGIHVGEAQDVEEVNEQRDVQGLAADLTSRVMSLAMPGQILLTRAAYGDARQFVQQHPAVEATARPVLRWLAHGRYLFKGYDEPLEVFEVGAEGVAPLARPPDCEKAGRVAPNNLPRYKERTSFVGRVRELAQLKRLLGTTSLLTLTGSGGCGKTRLAVRFAGDLLDQFPEGVWFVELEAISDPGLVAQQVRSTLDLKDQVDKTVTQTLIDYLREKTALLILDNCEHLLEACARLINDLLRNCPDLKVLATSQQRLGIPGEIPHRVPSLSLPAGGASPRASDLTGSEAVVLFVERAAALDPAFQLNDATAPAVAEICRRVDGIPLAIELAAAWVRVISLDEIVTYLDEMFRILTDGGRTVPDRHQTLRATIQRSYDLLKRDERLLLQRFSTFVGGWTLEAAKKVCSDGQGRGAWCPAPPPAVLIPEGEVLRLLTSLFDQSLVVSEEKADEQRRYRLLESVRQFAHEELSRAGAAEIAHDRHLDFFLALAEEAEPRLLGREQKTWLELLEADHNNLRAALRWHESRQTALAAVAPNELPARCGEGGASCAEKGLRLAGALWYFWDVRGHYAVGREEMGKLRARADRASPMAALAKVLNGAGYLAFRQGDLAEGKELAEKSLSIRRELQDPSGTAHSLTNLGNILQDLGDCEAARLCFQEARALHLKAGDRLWAAGNLLNLAIVALQLADFTEVRRLSEEVQRIPQELWNLTWEALRIETLANAARDQGDCATARALYRKSVAIRKDLGDKLGIVVSLEGVGGLASATGQPERAARLLGRAERLREELGSPLRPSDRVRYDRDVAAARGALAPAALARAWAAGRVMPWQQVIEEVLDCLGPDP